MITSIFTSGRKEEPGKVLTSAVEALRENHFDRDEHLIASVLADHPEDPEALRLLGLAARAAGRVEEAEHCLRRAIAHAPRSAPAYADLCGLLFDLHRAEEAIALLDRVAAAQDAPAWTHSLKAATWIAERRPHEALPELAALTGKAPRAPVAWINLAEALQATGDLDGAIDAYRQALACNPHCAGAWLGLAGLRVVRFEAADIPAMETALACAPSDLARVQMGYALGKALGDRGAYEMSFRHFERANALRGSLAAYDPAALESAVAGLEQAVALRKGEPMAGRGSIDGRPIFIVGMPRSGSTLVEQILSCHPQVEGLGELFELRAAAMRLAAAPEALAAAIGTSAWADLSGLAEQYLRGTRRYRRRASRYFTDKMPANWQLVPLIRLILPQARIIDVRRDPVPCCLSGFMTYFNRQTAFPANLRDLLRYYDSYAGLMDRMRGAHPADIHLVRYEDLVLRPEREVRRLLDYLELAFDPACLKPESSLRPVFTPSAQQVRKPIGFEKRERWRNYMPWFPSSREET